MLDSFTNESLFYELTDVLDEVDTFKGKITTKVENWMDAKIFVKMLFSNKAPKVYLRPYIQGLESDLSRIDPHYRAEKNANPIAANTALIIGILERDAILIPAYAMIKYIAKFNSERRKDCEGVLESLENFAYSEDHFFDGNMIDNITGIFVKSKELAYDYDYTQTLALENTTDPASQVLLHITPAPEPLVSTPPTTLDDTAHLKKELADLQAKYEDLMDRYNDQKKKWDEFDSVQQEQGSINQKVRLEIVARLLEENGAKIGKDCAHGNKSKAGSLINKITDIRFETCKKYMTERNLNTGAHSEDIKNINDILEEIGITWQL